MADLSRFFPAGAPTVFTALAQPLWILQIARAIHVYRTGRPYWWICILFMAPLIGGLAYIIIELLPGFRAPEGLFHSLKPRKWRITCRGERVFEGGFSKRSAHAGRCGQIQDRLGAACGSLCDFRAGRYDWQQDARLELQVMRGDCLVALERYPEAEAAYQSVIERYIGEAPRAGMSTIYEKTGRGERAMALWKEIMKKFRKASPAWRRTERKWYKFAAAKLQAQKS